MLSTTPFKSVIVILIPSTEVLSFIANLFTTGFGKSVAYINFPVISSLPADLACGEFLVTVTGYEISVWKKKKR